MYHDGLARELEIEAAGTIVADPSANDCFRRSSKSHNTKASWMIIDAENGGLPSSDVFQLVKTIPAKTNICLILQHEIDSEEVEDDDEEKEDSEEEEDEETSRQNQSSRPIVSTKELSDLLAQK